MNEKTAPPEQVSALDEGEHDIEIEVEPSVEAGQDNTHHLRANRRTSTNNDETTQTNWVCYCCEYDAAESELEEANKRQAKARQKRDEIRDKMLRRMGL